MAGRLTRIHPTSLAISWVTVRTASRPRVHEALRHFNDERLAGASFDGEELETIAFKRDSYFGGHTGRGEFLHDVGEQIFQRGVAGDEGRVQRDCSKDDAIDGQLDVHR